jgi:hypothetical protein
VSLSTSPEPTGGLRASSGRDGSSNPVGGACLIVVPPDFKPTEANVADDPTPTITEQERTTLEERQRALAAAAAAVKDGVANYNACLAALQEVAAAIAARLRAAYEAGSSDPLSRGALITDLDAIASMTALNATLLGLTDPPPI